MKVLEDRCPFSSIAMGKRKPRTPTCDDTSDDNLSSAGLLPPGKPCIHLTKSLKFEAWKKNLGTKTSTLSVQCSACAKDNNTCTAAETQDVCTDDGCVWFCLRCANQGCGRNTKEQHALKHASQARSDPHKIAVELRTWRVWCYECDDELSLHCSKRLEEAVMFIQRRVEFIQSIDNRTPASAELSETTNNTAPSVNNTARNTKQQQPAATGAPRPKLKGLTNLGNTCFFNAVIQSLSQVKEFTCLLNEIIQRDTLKLPGFSPQNYHLGSDFEDSDSEENKPDSLAPRTISLGKDDAGILTNTLNNLLTEMSSDQNPKSTLNPRAVFDQICKKVPRFKGYQQQDSHELLRNLLDHVKNEEIKRHQTGILNSFNYKTLDAQSKRQVESAIKSYGQQVKFTTVDSLFGGYLLSTVLCKACEYSSQIFEPFLDLSLPVYEEKTQRGIRRPSRCSVDQSDDLPLQEDKREPSKHQRKKAKQNAKHNRKIKSKTKEMTQDGDPGASAEPENQNETIEGAASNEAAVVEKSQATTPEPDQAFIPETINKLDSCASSSVSRSGSPKSGYCSDMEDSERPGAAGSQMEQSALVNSLENLSLEDDFQLETVKEAVKLSLMTLKSRQQASSHECSVLSCLGQFMAPDLLTGSNKYACSMCNKRERKKSANPKGKHQTVYSNAVKSLTIISPPAILTLHLKRFQQNGYSFSKVQKHVDFTVTLDLAPYCSKLAIGIEEGQTSVKYSLFAVVEHSGTLSMGHYTAYVKNRQLTKLHETMRQKSLQNQKPYVVLLNRVAELNASMEQSEGLEDDAIENAEDEGNTASTRWFHISDSYVKEVSERTVLDAQAYLLFYERVK